MRSKVREKARAITLRKKGYTYREILKELPVAKSSLSLWLADLSLTIQEKHALKKRKESNISRGRMRAASALQRRRLAKERRWFLEAKKDFGKHKRDPFFHTGIALYWAEGAKRVNQWSFSNSDEQMIKVMIKWLEKYVHVKSEELFFRLYVHKPYAHENCEQWWAKQLGVGFSQFTKTIYKPTRLGVKKRPQYKGCLRIEVRKSRHLLCQMKFWQNMLVEHYHKE